jgi:hypothetical protein
MDGFVDRLHALRFLRACDPGYRALTLTLVGLTPTEHISLLLDIRLGILLLFTEEFELVIMIEVVIEEMHGSDRNSWPETITSEPWLVWQLIPTRAKWRSFSESMLQCARKSA